MAMRRVARRLLVRLAMRKQHKLTVQRHTIKSLDLDEVIGGRARTSDGPDPDPGPSVANSRCSSCTYGCASQLFC